MNLFELFSILSLRSDGFTNGIKDASETMQSFGDRIDAIAAAAGKAITAGMTLASGAVVAFAKESVDVGKQFDAAMANVAAISSATSEQLNDLRGTAIAMGGSTKFSATEAADALGYMAMAGWKPQQMIDGLKGVMDLAAASGENLARVSDIVTDALTAFSLKAEDSAHFADVLAVASSAANTTVSMMGETFKYVAPLAGTLGYTIEDMAVSIGLMANAGIKASQAGTSLRAGLSKLVKPTDSAITKLKELGLTVQDMGDEEIAAKTAALEASVSAREKAYSDDEEALRESLDRQYDALRKSLEARYNAQKEAFDNEYEERKKALDKSYDAAKDIADKEYEERKKTLDAEYDALEKTLDAEVEAVQKANEKTLSDTQKSQERTVKEYEKATEARLALIDEEYKESLRLTNEAEYNRLKGLDDQIATIQAQSDAAAKAAEDEERRQRRAELQKAVNTAKTAEARREAEQKLADYNKNIRRKDEEAARKAQIADLKAQKEQAKEEAKAARETAKEARDAEVKSYKETRAKGLEELKETQKQELAELKDRQKTELEAAKATRKEQLDAAKEANAQDLKELKELNEWRLSTIKEANEDELKSLRKAQSDQLSAVKDGNNDKLKAAKDGHSKQLQALKDANKEQLAEYQDSVKKQVAELKKQGEARAAVLTDDKGNTRDFIEVVKILREKFKGLSEAEQSEYAAAIFGQEAMSGWLAIINASEDDFNDLRKEINAASVSNEKFVEAMEKNGFSADAMRASMAKLGVTEEEFNEALKKSKGKVKDFREALQKAADSGVTLNDIDNNLTISGKELEKVFGSMSAAAQMALTHEDSLAGSATTLSSALETLKIRLSDEITPALRKFTEFAQTSVVTLTKAFEDGGLDGMMSALAPIITDGIGMILEYLPNVVTIGGQILGAVVTGLINNIPLLWDGALKVASAFVGYLRDAFRGVFENFGLGEQFNAVFESVSQAFEQVRNAVTGAFERIKTAFSAAFGEYFTSGQAAQDATNLLITAIGFLGDAFSTAADIVATVVENIINFVSWLSEGSTGADVFIAAITGIVTAFAAFKTAMAIKDIIDKATKAFSLFNAVLAANPLVLVAALIAGVVVALITLWHTNEDFRNAVINIGNAIKDFVTGLVDTVVGFFTKTIPDALAALREFVSEKTREIKDFFINLRDGIIEAFANIGKWFEDKFTAAYNAVTGAWNGVGKWFSDRWTDISNAFTGAVTWFGDTFDAAWKGVTDAFGSVKDFFSGVWNDITGVFTGAFEWFKDIGKNIINGLKEGIGGLWNGFISFLSGKTDEVKDEFEGEQGFDTHSPSKWSEKVFRNVLQGGEIGLERGLPDMLSSAKSTVQGIQDALTADPFNVSGGYSVTTNPAYSPVGVASPRGAAQGQIETVRVEQPIQITVDKRVLGEMMYTYLQTRFRAEGARGWT